MKKRKPRQTQRNIIEETFGGKPPVEAYMIDRMEVAEFQPSLPNAPIEVHLLLYIQGSDIPIVMRFKSPDSLGDCISALTKHRNRVWPDAEPVGIGKKGDV